MGRSDKVKGPPEISLERLRSLPAEEQSGSWKLYKKLGGRRRCLPKSVVEEFLLRSTLGPEVVKSILDTALTGDAGDDVDFECFCVACRLVAQMQELGHFASISDVPANPPYFAEEHEEQAAEDKGEEQKSEFDFEGVAFGVISQGLRFICDSLLIVFLLLPFPQFETRMRKYMHT